MKKFTLSLYIACLAATLQFGDAADSTTTATEKPKRAERRARPALTEEQKQLRKDILAKYDINKDKRLDKEERAKISDEDKEKMKKAGIAPAQRRAAKPGAKNSAKSPDSKDSK